MERSIGIKTESIDIKTEEIDIEDSDSSLEENTETSSYVLQKTVSIGTESSQENPKIVSQGSLIPIETVFIKQDVDEAPKNLISTNLARCLADAGIKRADTDEEYTDPETKIQCPSCPKIFTSREKYRDHKRYHVNNRPYKCTECDKAFRNNSSRNIHMSVHTGAKPFECYVCKKRYTQNSTLNMHIREHHADETHYQCNLCEFKSGDGNELRRHLKNHSEEEHYECRICEYKALNTADFKRHMRAEHSDFKPFICKICDYRSKTVTYLKEHLRTHEVEKLHVCSQCGTSFGKLGNLTIHIKNKHS